MTLSDWVEAKLALAEKLNAGHGGGGYPEACLVIASVISAQASDLWPGPRIDRRRFVQTWVSYSAQPTDSCHISLPLLIAELTASRLASEAAALAATHRAFSFPYDTLVVTGADVDLPEHRVLAACPSVPLRLVRAHSYPTLFYEHVRSAYVHEYGIAIYGKASGRPWNPGATVIEYSNLFVSENDSRRQIHFPIPWLSAVVRSMVPALTPALSGPRPPVPAPWWLDE